MQRETINAWLRSRVGIWTQGISIFVLSLLLRHLVFGHASWLAAGLFAAPFAVIWTLAMLVGPRDIPRDR